MITRKDLSEEQEVSLQYMLDFAKGTSRQMVLAGYAGTGKCLDINNIIWTEKGFARLRSLTNSKHECDSAINCDLSVLSFDQKKRKLIVDKATQIWNDSKTNGIEFTLDKGYTHRVSEWHPIYCSIDGDVKYHKASYIAECIDDNKDVWFPMIKGHPNLINETYLTIETDRFSTELNPNIGYILGCLVGDGSLTNTTRNQLRFSSIDKDIITSLHRNAFENSISIKIDPISGSSCDWRITCSELSDLVRKLNMIVTSDKKCIPDEIISSPTNVVISFIRGLFDTDGSSDKRDGYIEYCSSSKQLSEDVQNILLGIGIISTRKYRPNDKKGAYNIYIRGEHAYKYYNEIGFGCNRKQNRSRCLPKQHNTNDKLYPPNISSLMETAFKSRKDRGIENDDIALDRIGSYYKKNNKLSNYYVDYYKGRRTPSRSKLLEFIQDTNSSEIDELSFYVSDNKFWLKAKKCESVTVDLYDLVVPNNYSFISNGIINHNTTLVNVFLRELNKIKISRRRAKSTCTAPTNEAVRVLSANSDDDYDKTIFSLLGLVLLEEEGEKPTIVQNGTPRLDEFNVIILDEASMVGDYLLSLIETELKKHPSVKMIYVGDDAQLPPVVTQDDKDEEEVTESKVFQLKNRTNLVEIQRVSKDNPVINVVTPIRNDINSPVDKFERKTILNEDGHGVEFIDDRNSFMEMMYDDFCTDEYRKNSNYVRAIAYTNKAVNAMNRAIRCRIFETRDLEQFMVGENLIVNNPIMERTNRYVWKLLYTVGERLRVVAINRQVDPEFGFNLWKLTVIDYENKKPEEKVITVLDDSDTDLYHHTKNGIANDCKDRAMMTYINRNGKVKSRYTRFEAWKPYYDFKNEYSWVKYSYAMTTHKSQGSTIERVYVVERDLNRLTWNDTIRNKLKYTAFTRTSKLLRILQ